MCRKLTYPRAVPGCSGNREHARTEYERACVRPALISYQHTLRAADQETLINRVASSFYDHNLSRFAHRLTLDDFLSCLSSSRSHHNIPNAWRDDGFRY